MSISNRIHKLEELLGVGGRVIVLSQPCDMSDEDLEYYLESQGISSRTEDLIISLRRLGEGHPAPWVTIDGIPA
jgi:hypothetical protein